MKVNTIEVDYVKVCENSNYFRSLSNFKEANTTNLTIEDLKNVDHDVLQTFLTIFLPKGVDDSNLLSVVEYSYDIRQLMTFFGCDKAMDEYFSTLLELFLSKLKCNLAHINAQIMISFYYLYKNDRFDLNKYIDVLYLDNGYITIMDDVRSEMENQEEFLELYDIWLKPMKYNVALSMKRLVSVFSFDLSYKPLRLEPKIKNKSVEFKDGDTHCVSGIEEFKGRLCQFIGGIDLADFNWKNVVMAGGSVLACILQRDWLPSSDLDLWIYGLDNASGIAKMQEIIAYFGKKIGRPAIYIKNKSIITLCFADYPRNIQVILTEKANPFEVIADYDMDYICCIYDGTDVMGTTYFMRALISQTCSDKDTVRPDRLLKAWLKEFSLLYGHNFENDQGKIDRILNKYYYPAEGEFANKSRLKMMVNTFIKGECYFAHEDIKYDEMEGFEINLDYEDAHQLNNVKFGTIPKEIKWNYAIFENESFHDYGHISQGGMNLIQFRRNITLITGITYLRYIEFICMYDHKALIRFENDPINSLGDLSRIINKKCAEYAAKLARQSGLKQPILMGNALSHGHFYTYISGKENQDKYGITKDTMNGDKLKGGKCGAQYKILIKGMRLNINNDCVIPKLYYDILDVKYYPANVAKNSRYTLSGLDEELDV